MAHQCRIAQRAWLTRPRGAGTVVTFTLTVAQVFSRRMEGSRRITEQRLRGSDAEHPANTARFEKFVTLVHGSVVGHDHLQGGAMMQKPNVHIQITTVHCSIPR